MESPASWGEAEKVISRSLDEAARAREQGICGWSAPKRVAEALRSHNMLRDTGNLCRTCGSRMEILQFCGECGKTPTLQRCLTCHPDRGIQGGIIA